MKSSKLIQALASFSDKEFKKFEKYAMQFFNKNEKMLSFIEFIGFHFPDFKEEEISKLNAYKYVFQNDVFEDVRVRELMAALNKMLRDYIVIENIKAKDFYYELELLKFYKDKELQSHYDLQLKSIKKILKKDKFKNIENFRRKYLLADIENEHFTKKHIRALDENVQLKLDNLDFLYFSTKLKESCEMLNRQRLLNQQYNFNMFEEIETLIEKYLNSYLNHPTIVCYYEIYKLLKTKDDVLLLKNCLEVLNRNNSKFTDIELKSLYDFPQNYCIAQVNKGNSLFIEILFDLQKSILIESFNLIDGFISQISYRNIVSIALKLKKFDWSEKFIEDYKDKVAPEFRENSYNMNKANLYYSIKEYDKTIQLLNQVEFTDAYFAYYSKIILLKTYYAKKEFETLPYFITAFKLHLKRNNQVSSSFKKSTDLFLSYFKKILNIAEKIDFLDNKITEKKLKNLIESIKKEKVVLNRVWLIDIVENLKN